MWRESVFLEYNCLWNCHNKILINVLSAVNWKKIKRQKTKANFLLKQKHLTIISLKRKTLIRTLWRFAWRFTKNVSTAKSYVFILWYKYVYKIIFVWHHEQRIELIFIKRAYDSIYWFSSFSRKNQFNRPKINEMFDILK